MRKSTSFWPFFGLMLIHSLFYVPTISITNSIAFANLKDPRASSARSGCGARSAGSPHRGRSSSSWSTGPRCPPMGDVGPINWLGTALGTSKTGPTTHAAHSATSSWSPGSPRLLLAAVQLRLAAHAAEARDGRGFARLAEGDALAQAPVRAGPLHRHVHRRGRASELLLLDLRFLWHESAFPANWVLPVMKIGQIAEIVTMLVLGYVLKKLGWRTTMIARRPRARGALRRLRLLPRAVRPRSPSTCCTASATPSSSRPFTSSSTSTSRRTCVRAPRACSTC